MSDNSWCEIHEEVINEGALCYVCGVVKAERERIIKLLESDPENIIPIGGGLRAGYEMAIVLIKGGQK